MGRCVFSALRSPSLGGDPARAHIRARPRSFAAFPPHVTAPAAVLPEAAPPPLPRQANDPRRELSSLAPRRLRSVPRTYRTRLRTHSPPRPHGGGGDPGPPRRSRGAGDRSQREVSGGGRTPSTGDLGPREPSERPASTSRAPAVPRRLWALSGSWDEHQAEISLAPPLAPPTASARSYGNRSVDTDSPKLSPSQARVQVGPRG